MKNITLILLLSSIATVLLILNAIPVIWWAYDTLLLNEEWGVRDSLLLVFGTGFNLLIQLGLHTWMGVLGYNEFKRRRETKNPSPQKHLPPLPTES